MHLYRGSTRQFIDATQARLANQLSDRLFDEFRYRPAPSEVHGPARDFPLTLAEGTAIELSRPAEAGTSGEDSRVVQGSFK